MKIALTPRQRLLLAFLFYNKFDGTKDIPLPTVLLYNRTRLALGLTPIMTLIRERRMNNPAVVTDVPAAFALTRDQAMYLTEEILTGIRTAEQADLLGDLLQDLLEALKDSPTGVALTAAEITAPDYASEDWTMPNDALPLAVRGLVGLALTLQVPANDVHAMLQESFAAQSSPATSN